MVNSTHPGGRSAVLLIGAAVALIVLACAGCGRGEGPRPPGPLRVVVSIAPLTGLVRALAPPDATVTTLIPAGRSLHGYEMTPTDLAAVGTADVLVYVGLGLEPSVDRVLGIHPSKRRRVVCFARVAGVEDPHAGHDHHEHGDDEHHDHGHAVDPHLWLDPQLVARLIPEVSDAIEAALQGMDALTVAGESRLREARNRLRAEVEAIDAEHQERLGPFKGAAIVTHHNAFGRLADRYGFTIAAVIRPVEGAEPTPAAVAAAVDAIRRENARAVFFEPQFDAAAAEAIARAAGVPVGTLDPEGRSDWFALMRSNLDELTRLLAR
ncbi:MAG: metal ABC transporter substrate-binding protein [Phycisphaerales bacterium]